jgi:hypothetical protein
VTRPPAAQIGGYTPLAGGRNCFTMTFSMRMPSGSGPVSSPVSARHPRPRHGTASVITPPSAVAALRARYKAQIDDAAR